MCNGCYVLGPIGRRDLGYKNNLSTKQLKEAEFSSKIPSACGGRLDHYDTPWKCRNLADWGSLEEPCLLSASLVPCKIHAAFDLPGVPRLLSVPLTLHFLLWWFFMMSLML